MSIKSKLIVVFLVMTLVPLFFVSLITFNNYKKSLESVRLSQLANLVAVKSERLEEHFSRLKAEIEMAEYFYNIRQNLPLVTQFANDPSSQEFRTANAMLDGQLSRMQDVLGLSSIMLVGPGGKVVYTSDAASRARYLYRPLPDPEQKAFSEGKKGVYFSEVFFNPARDNALQMLVTAPAYDFNNTFAGVIAFEIDMIPINRMAQDTTGLGETGETLIGKAVGDEVVFLNPLRHDPEAALRKRVTIGGTAGGPVQDAALGKTGSGQLVDYRLQPVIAAWQPIPLVGWGIVAKIDTDEAFADVTRLRNLLFLIWGGVIVLGGVLAYAIAGSISGPIRKLSEGARIVGQGNLDYKVATEEKDEIGQLSRSFDEMIGDLQRVMASRDELHEEIAARERIAAALRASEERWATTLSSIGDGVIAADTDGSITFMNAVAERLTGWTSAEAEGLPMREVFSIVNEQTRAAVDNPAIVALETGTIVALANHTILIRKDRTEVPIDDSGAPIKDRDGKNIGSVLIFRDITERKLAEAAKNNFIAVLAHELRNPLAPLLLSVQRIEMQAGAPSDHLPAFKESTDIALRQIHTMTRLLDDLLDVSRIERGKIQLKMEKVELARAIEHAVTSASSIIKERDHEITVSLPPEPILLEADPVRLEQIIVNVVNNAAKYTDRGGHIWIAAQRVGDTAEITVRDDGMGISPDKLPHIFEPFYQTEKALRRSHGGLGLGLMLVKNLLHMHHGSIAVQSPGEGKGSEFIMRLPALPTGTSLPSVTHAAVPDPAPRADTGAKKNILVVDDNHSIADLMQNLLGHFGHRVTVAHDGKSAVALARTIQPDIVLCDIGLPEMDGYEVARAIRQEEQEGTRIVMVAVTGFGQEEDRRHSREAGFDYHLVKPITLEKLRQIVGG